MPLPSVQIARRTCKLPALLFREVGRLITVFSCIEHEMNLVTYSLLRLSPSEGRLAVARQNVRSRFHLIATLLELNVVSITHDLRALSNEVTELEELRDWLAHGVWTLAKGVPQLQISRGTWRPKGAPKKFERKVIPACAPIDQQTLREISFVAVHLLAVVEDIHKQVSEQLQPLPKKRQVRPRDLSKPRKHPKSIGR